MIIILSFYGRQMALRSRKNGLIPFNQILKPDQISSEYIKGTYNIGDQNWHR